MGSRNSKPRQVIACGLDNSGKSTLVNYLKPKKEKREELGPTVGFSPEHLRLKGLRLQVFDMAGGSRYRSLWEAQFDGVEMVLFVLDCSDKMRVAVAKDELENLLKHPALEGVPILFFANKQDVPNSLSSDECVENFNLAAIDGRRWAIFPTVAITGEGVDQAVAWLSNELKGKNKKK